MWCRTLLALSLLVLSVIAFSTRHAMAAFLNGGGGSGDYCTSNPTSPLCLYSGSLSCEKIAASGLGNVSLDDKYVACYGLPLPDGDGTIPVVVFCANKGGNVAPGVQAVSPVQFTGESTIFPAEVDDNGHATDLKVHSVLSPEELAELDQACHDALNKNWFAVDAVGIDMLVKVFLWDDPDGNTVLDELDYTCHLPNGESLGWDKKAQAPERRLYECNPYPTNS
jgi:hypothetical protein